MSADVVLHAAYYAALQALRIPCRFSKSIDTAVIGLSERFQAILDKYRAYHSPSPSAAESSLLSHRPLPSSLPTARDVAAVIVSAQQLTHLILCAGLVGAAAAYSFSHLLPWPLSWFSWTGRVAVTGCTIMAVEAWQASCALSYEYYHFAADPSRPVPQQECGERAQQLTYSILSRSPVASTLALFWLPNSCHHIASSFDDHILSAVQAPLSASA